MGATPRWFGSRRRWGVWFYQRESTVGAPKGNRNNPHGRPPKERSLTALLEKAGNTKVIDADGKEVTGKQLAAQYVWEAITTGSVLMPNGYAMHFDAKEWSALAKWVYGQVDGPPKQEHDITSAGEALTFTIEIDRRDDDSDAE